MSILTSSEHYSKLLVGTYYLCGNILLGCSSSGTVSRIPNRGRITIFVEASGGQCLELCQEHVVLHHVVRIREVAGSIRRILLICANEAASLNKLRQLSSSVILHFAVRHLYAT